MKKLREPKELGAAILNAVKAHAKANGTSIGDELERIGINTTPYHWANGTRTPVYYSLWCYSEAGYDMESILFRDAD